MNPLNFVFSPDQLNELIIEAATSGHLGAMQNILRQGASPHALDQLGRPIAFLATRHVSPDCLALLLDAGVHPDEPSPRGETPLIEAAARGSIACLSLLLERHADPRASDREGWTALMRAAQNGNSTCVAPLRGSNLSAKNHFGFTAAMLAARYEASDVLRELALLGDDFEGCESVARGHCLDFIRAHRERLALQSTCPQAQASKSSLRM